MSDNKELRKLLEQIPGKAIETRKNFGAIILLEKMKTVCLSHPSETSSEVQIHNLEMVGKQLFREKMYYSDEKDIKEMLLFAIFNLHDKLCEDSELLRMSIESIESVYEEFEKFRTVFNDKTSMTKNKKQKQYSKERLEALLIDMPSIAIKARKTYSAIDLMHRIRKVCFTDSHTTSNSDKHDVLMNVWLRMYWILNEFSMEELNEMILYSVNYLNSFFKNQIDQRNQAMEDIKSIIENFDIYFNEFGKFRNNPEVS